MSLIVGNNNIRLYNSHDIPQIMAIMKSLYDEKTAAAAEKRWLWQYHQSPLALQNGVAVYVYDIDGEIQSIIGGMRQQFIMEGECVEGIWLVDFMSRPNTNGRYGVKLGRAVTQMHPLCVGQNSPQLNRYWAYVLKGNLVNISEPNMLIKPLTITPALPKFLWENPLRPLLEVMTKNLIRAFFPERGELNTTYIVNKVDTFDERCNELWEQCKTDYRSTVVRNQDYLNWRYHKASGFEYDCFQLEENGALKAWVVGRKYFKDGIWKARIVDYLAEKSDERSWHQLFLTICQYYRGQNVSLVQMISSQERMIEKYMMENNFKPHSDKGRLSAYIATTPKNHSMYSLLNKEKPCWHMTFGDTDLDFY